MTAPPSVPATAGDGAAAPTADRRADRRALAVVGAMCLVYAVQFSLWSIHRFDNFRARRFDLGNMVQAVWGVSNGDLLMTSTDVVGDQVSRFAGHVEPIMWLLGPAWWVWGSPVMLLVVQAVAIASSGLAAYLIGRAWIGSRAVSVAFCAVTLMYPLIQAQTLFDFHPVSLATPLLLWAIWAAATRHDLTLGLMVVLAACTKEQVGLALFVLGIWIALSLRRRVAGALVGGFGLLWSAVVIGVVMPHYRTRGAETMLVDRYSRFGDSTGEAVVNLVVHPLRSAELLLTEGRVAFVLAMLIPLLFLPLRAPLLALAAGPDLLINLMSSHPQQHQVAYHYGAVTAPILIAAAIRAVGAIRARERGPLRRAAGGDTRTVGILVVATLVGSYLFSPLPVWGSPPLGRYAGVSGGRAQAVTTTDPRAAAMAAAVRLIPSDAAVSAGNGFGAHLSARRRILTFPALGDARWVVVDKELAAMGDGRDRAAHRERVDRLLGRPGTRVVFERDDILVITREPQE